MNVAEFKALPDWIPYDGQICPVTTGTLVDVLTRSGMWGTLLYANTGAWDESSQGAGMAYDWTTEEVSGDIIAYRFSDDLSEKVEPD